MIPLAESAEAWALIAERLGIPFAILLMVFMFLAACAAWFAKHVAKPVTKGHLEFMAKCGDAVVTLKENEIAQTAEIKEIRKAADSTASDVKQLKGMVSKINRPTLPGINGEIAPAPN